MTNVRRSTAIATGMGPPWLRIVLASIATFWIALLVFVRVSSKLEFKVPAVPRFLLQCSCLFPYSAEMRIDYRVEGWSCARQGWYELDYKPYFPIHSDDKESEFARLGHFYREDKPAMDALDTYLVSHHNQRVASGGDADDGIAGPIGGIRFLSLRIPLPEVGGHVEPYREMPIKEISPDHRKYWFATDPDLRAQRCAEAAP